MAVKMALRYRRRVPLRQWTDMDPLEPHASAKACGGGTRREHHRSGLAPSQSTSCLPRAPCSHLSGTPKWHAVSMARLYRLPLPLSYVLVTRRRKPLSPHGSPQLHGSKREVNPHQGQYRGLTLCVLVRPAPFRICCNSLNSLLQSPRSSCRWPTCCG